MAFSAIVLLCACAGRTPPMESPRGISSLEKVEINGVKQWILIRGEDAANPVLLFLHGGPGSPEMTTQHRFGRRLEQDFVLVHWDQRGAGKSYHVSIPEQTMNVGQFIEDARVLTELLRARFGREKIYVVGHSWGSLLGVLTVQRHPELFHAYVGIGQVVDLVRNEEISYSYVLDQARERDNKLALLQLEMIGPPPYRGIMGLAIQRQWLQRFGGAMHDPGMMKKVYLAGMRAPEYTPVDQTRFIYGTYYSIRRMWDEVMTFNLIEQAPRLEVPVYFLHGRHDYNTPWELAEEYYRKLEAPRGKTMIWFENSAHSPNLEEPERFAEVMVNRVLAETRSQARTSGGPPTF